MAKPFGNQFPLVVSLIAYINPHPLVLHSSLLRLNQFLHKFQEKKVSLRSKRPSRTVKWRSTSPIFLLRLRIFPPGIRRRRVRRRRLRTKLGRRISLTKRRRSSFVIELSRSFSRTRMDRVLSSPSVCLFFF